MEFNSTLSIEIGLRLTFNTKTTLSDRFFTSYVGLLGVEVELNSTLGIEIGLRLKFNNRTTPSDRFFTGYAGLLGVSGRCGGLNPASCTEIGRRPKCNPGQCLLIDISLFVRGF